MCPTHRDKVQDHLPTALTISVEMLSASSVRDAFLRALSEQVNAVKHSVGLSFWLSVHSLSLLRDGVWVFGERHRSRCASLFQSH